MKIPKQKIKNAKFFVLSVIAITSVFSIVSFFKIGNKIIMSDVFLLKNSAAFGSEKKAIDDLYNFAARWDKQNVKWKHENCCFEFNVIRDNVSSKENYSVPRIIKCIAASSPKKDLLKIFCDLAGVSKEDVLAQTEIVYKDLIEIEKQKQKQEIMIEQDESMIKIFGKSISVPSDDYELGKYKTALCFPDVFHLLHVEANENDKIANLLRCCAKNTNNVSNAFDLVDFHIDDSDRIDFGVSKKVFGLVFSMRGEKAHFIVCDVNRNELYSIDAVNPDLIHFVNYFHITLDNFQKMRCESMHKFAESNSYKNWCKKYPSPSMLKEKQQKNIKRLIKIGISAIVIASSIFVPYWI